MKRIALTLTVALLLGHCSLAGAQDLQWGQFPNQQVQHVSTRDKGPVLEPLRFTDQSPAPPAAVQPTSAGFAAGQAAAPEEAYYWPQESFVECCEEVNPFSATISLNQDVFFGFYPAVAGSYAITDRMDFTFYSILWTAPFLAGTVADTVGADAPGQGLWTEVGAGVNFSYLDGDLNVNPQLGVLNGNLLSGADRPLAFEGLVPNLTVNHDTTWTESEFYFGYYLATRSPRQNDFIHWWVNTGIKPFAWHDTWKSILSTGVHFEHLRLSRTRGGDATDIFAWLGPYVQFALPNDVVLRFGAGWDVSNQENNPDFYKVNLSYSF